MKLHSQIDRKTRTFRNIWKYLFVKHCQYSYIEVNEET